MTEILKETPPVPAAVAVVAEPTTAPPPAVAVAEGEGKGENSPPAPSPEAKPAAKAPRTKDWKDDRIATLTARLREKEAALPAAPAAAAAAAAPLDANVEFNRLVQAKASELFEAKSFGDKCNVERDRGIAKWDDFDEKMEDLKMMVDQTDPAGPKAYYDLLNAGLETGELHSIIYELGQDPDEAARFLKMSPVKMGIELTKKVLAGMKIDEVSKLPKPITPIAGGRGEQVPVDPGNPALADGLTTADWMKRREEQIKQRSAR